MAHPAGRFCRVGQGGERQRQRNDNRLASSGHSLAPEGTTTFFFRALSTPTPTPQPHTPL